MEKMKKEEVLKKLGISDISQLTKEKFLDFIAMYDRVDPEVAMKLLEQYPEFAKTMYSIFADYKANTSEVLKYQSESVMECHSKCTMMMEALKNELDKEIPFEEKKYYIETMKWVIEKTQEIDKDNKFFLDSSQGRFLLGALAFISVVAAGIGIHSYFRKR